MLWSELYNGEHEPSELQIKEFVETPLWEQLAEHLQQTYHARPKLSYSCCSMDNDAWKGWNIKYKKSGKSLCTLYPKQGYFVALIAIGAKESAEAEMLIPLCNQHTQEIYRNAKFGAGYKALALNVTNQYILQDTENLIALRISSH